MMSEEKQELLALLSDPHHWYQSAEARGADGQAVNHSDPEATAWDLTGAVCPLIGWRRACELFVQIERRLHPPHPAGLDGGDAAISAMIGLQSWNDDPQTSHPQLLTAMARVPVSHRPGNGKQLSATALHGAPDELTDGSPLGALGGVPEGSDA
jgi:hypothetical protein